MDKTTDTTTTEPKQIPKPRRFTYIIPGDFKHPIIEFTGHFTPREIDRMAKIAKKELIRVNRKKAQELKVEEIKKGIAKPKIDDLPWPYTDNKQTKTER